MKKLGFGLMRLPLTDNDNVQSIDQQHTNRMVDRFLESGFNYFDTAYPYHGGLSENAAKKALTERHPRQSFLLADKMPVWLVTGPDDHQKFFSQQLERCGVDYFDYYLLHNLGEKNYASTLKHGGFPFLRELKASGKAGKIGFSYHDKADLLDRILTEQPDVDFVQLQINYIDWDNATMEARRCYETAVKHGVPVIAMEPVKGGTLAQVPDEADRLFRDYRSDRSPASWAVRYAASLDGVITVLSGMSTLDQVEDNLSYMEDFQPLNQDERDIIGRVAEIINSSIAVPCTSCQYCVEECPQRINIPKLFSLYNNQHRFRLFPMHHSYYMNLTHSAGKASDCIGCRACEEHCPQHIAIADQLQQVAAVFEPNR